MSGFRVEPEACLNAALAANLKSVVIIGLAKNGVPLVWCSDGTPDAYELIDRAKARIESPQFTREAA